MRECVGRCGCAKVWEVGGTGCSSSVLGSGVWGRQRREECGCTKIPARGATMQGNGIERVGWDGVGVGVGLLCCVCCVHLFVFIIHSMLLISSIRFVD